MKFVETATSTNAFCEWLRTCNNIKHTIEYVLRSQQNVQLRTFRETEVRSRAYAQERRLAFEEQQ